MVTVDSQVNFPVIDYSLTGSDRKCKKTGAQGSLSRFQQPAEFV